MRVEDLRDSDWVFVCPKCFRWKLVRDAGGVRIGAQSKGKRTIGHCKSCKKLRFVRVVQFKYLTDYEIDRMIESLDQAISL